MRFYCISDSADTLTGCRLAGIDGVLVSERQDVRDAVSRAAADPQIGILLITEKLAALAPELLGELKLKQSSTLAVEIPDRFGTGRSPDSITRYIREAIGIKV